MRRWSVLDVLLGIVVEPIPPIYLALDPVAVALAVLVSVPLVEVVRAGTAVLLGDDTPRLAGRLWRVDRNVHMTGTVLVPALLALAGVVAVGWSAPAPVREAALTRPRRAAIALAGPLAHLAVALAATLLPADLVREVAIANAATAALLLVPAPPLPGGALAAALLPSLSVPGSRWDRLRRTDRTPWALAVIVVGAVAGNLAA